MMAKLENVLSAVGDTTASYAGRVGSRTKDLAKTVGPKRGGIALGVLAVAIATPFVIRFLRARRADVELEEQVVGEGGSVKRRRRRDRNTRTSVARAPF